MNWGNKKVLVTGGASFIGSHLVDALIRKGAQVRVVDSLSSGKLENIQEHLGADHGGRGYVDLHQAACATNLALDGVVFDACYKAGVEKVVYASSGCVYPNFLQTDPDRELYLTEDLVKPPYDADNGLARELLDWEPESSSSTACARLLTGITQ
jgi:nucleoside-diphosphate-sugar epimerase